MSIGTDGSNIIALPAPQLSDSGFSLPESTWDDAQLLDYMRRHDKAIAGLNRLSLKHEFCFGAAAQLKYEELDGKWTQWAKDQGYPLETFRRRRLLFRRAGSLAALNRFDSKMEAYYDLGIYRRPSEKDLDALEARWEAQNKKTDGDTPGSKEKAEGKAGDIYKAEVEPRLQGGDENEGKPELKEQTEVGRKGDVRISGNGDGGWELVHEIEEGQQGNDEQGISITVPVTASTVTLIKLLAEQEGFEAGEVISAAVRECAANHLDRKVWEKFRLGKPEEPGAIENAG